MKHKYHVRRVNAVSGKPAGDPLEYDSKNPLKVGGLYLYLAGLPGAYIVIDKIK